MSKHSNSETNRWEELQVTRLLFGLTAEEKTEYDDLHVKSLPKNSISWTRW